MKFFVRSRSFFSSLILLVVFAGLQACGGGGGAAPVPVPILTVDAGLDQSVIEGTIVQLAGTSSNAKGAVTYAWTQNNVAGVDLSGSAINNPTFSAPMVTTQEVLEFTLTVTDSTGASASDIVLITVNNDNPPSVNAGADQIILEGRTVQLAGTGSDAEGSVLFSWAQIGGSTTVTLSDTAINNPTFTAPMVTTTELLEFTLTVTDSAGVSVTDIVLISVINDTPPSVNAGVDQTNVLTGTLVQLAGTGSDAEGLVSFNWTQKAGSTTVTLSDTAISNPTFTAPMITNTEVLEFTLTVTDSAGVSVSDIVLITVVNDTPPTVNAGLDQSVREGTTVQLAGTGSDAEGSVLFSWTQTAGTTVTLSNTSINNPTFTAPMVTSQEILEFTLTVTDGAGVSVSGIVLITVNDFNTVGSYLFYSNSLNAVDPDSPNSPTLIEPTANLVQEPDGYTTSAKLIKALQFDTSTKVVTNLHSHAVIYPKTDGRIYKVSALKAGSLTPVQISNEIQAALICPNTTGVRPDLVNVDDSQYYYSLPGSDGTCGTSNDVWKMVRLGMTANDAPIIAKKPVNAIINFSTGVLSSWLVHDAGALKKCDANFANCTTTKANAISISGAFSITPEATLLNIDNNLYIYNHKTSALSSSLFTIADGTDITIPASDGTMLYFGYGSSVYQLPTDGNSIATILQTEGNIIKRVASGLNSVVYELEGSGGFLSQEIKSVAKAGGATPVTLATATGTDNIFLMFVTGAKVYYNITNVQTPWKLIPKFAGVINENATGKIETATAIWSGATFKTTYDADLVNSSGSFIDKMIRVEGYDLAGTSGGYAGATIKTLDAVTASAGVTIGTLPDTDNVYNFLCYGGLDVLCSATIVIDPLAVPPPMQRDVYFIESETAGSLKRVTTTPNESEISFF